MTMRFLLIALLFLSAASYGGTKVTPPRASNMSVLTSNNTGYLSEQSLWKNGDTVNSYIDRLGRRTPIGVTPRRRVPIASIGNLVKGVMYSAPLALAGSAMFEVLLSGIDWVMNEGTLMKRTEDVLPVDTSSIYFTVVGKSGTHSSAIAAANSFVNAIGYTCCTYEFVGLGTPAPSSVGYQIPFYYTQTYKSNGAVSQHTHYIDQHKTSCTNGEWSPSLYGCVGVALTPVTEPEIFALDFEGYNWEFYDQIAQDACNGSISPTRCFDELVSQELLWGPDTVDGPTTKSTSYQTNSDGTTSTVEKETKTQYDIEYGDNHFVYTPKETTTTKVDGQTTNTTVEEETTSPDSEQKPEEEQPASEISGLQCQATVACSGDAIQCAIASTEKDTKCILEELATIEETDLRQQVQQDFSGSDYQPFGEGESSITDLSSLIDTSSSISASCPVLPVLSFEFHGQTRTFDFSEWLSILCEFAGWFGAILVIFSMRNGVEVIARGFG